MIPEHSKKLPPPLSCFVIKPAFAMVFTLFGVLLFAESGYTGEKGSTGRDNFKLSVGLFLPAIDSRVKVDSSSPEDGTEIDLESDLGLREFVTLGRLDGYWRFKSRHRIYFGYYGFGREARQIIDEEIKFGDEVFPIGTEIRSAWDIDFVYASYGYSFLQKEKWELSGSMGLYYLDTEFRISGRIPAEGEEEPEAVSDKAALNLPIPLFGFQCEYSVSPRLLVTAKAGYFALSVGKVNGGLFDLSANLEYRIHRYFSFGTGYLFFSADTESKKNGNNARLDYRYNGIQIYGTMHL